MLIFQHYKYNAFHIEYHNICVHKMCRIAGSIQLFRIRGRLTIENVRFKRNWIWDVLEIDWRNIGMMLNRNEINLPSSVVIPLRDKFRVRKLLRRQSLFFNVMLKQGKTWFTLNHNDRIPSIANTHA